MMPDLPGKLVPARGLDRVTDTRTIDKDTLLPERGPGLGERRIDLLIRGDVRFAEQSSDFPRKPLAGGFIEIEDGHANPSRGEVTGRGLPQPRCTTGHDGDHTSFKLHFPSFGEQHRFCNSGPAPILPSPARLHAAGMPPGQVNPATGRAW